MLKFPLDEGKTKEKHAGTLVNTKLNSIGGIR